MFSRAPLFLLLVAAAPVCSGYATVTHQELIDLAWDDSIRPLLLKRYPQTTPAQLRVAHAYAYGGCLVQDLGYYPFGQKLFSDLAHYVRSGDFVSALVRNARDVNELAFAVGALSHFVGDSTGHALAVNPGTGIEFPKLAEKYGRIVTYEDEPTAHVRTEFGFDVTQLARNRYAPRAYRDHIGFRVAGRLLERAFFETYGLTLWGVLGHTERSAFSYRIGVRWVIPWFARATIVGVQHGLPDDTSDPAFQELQRQLARTEHNYWNEPHHKPGIRAHILWLVLKAVPKVGALKILAVEAPKPEAELLFLRSVNVTLANYRGLLSDVLLEPDEFALVDRDLDTGQPIRPGAYRMADEAYAKLLHRVTKVDYKVPARLRQELLAYYADPQSPISTRRHPKEWKRVQKELATLREINERENRVATAASTEP